VIVKLNFNQNKKVKFLYFATSALWIISNLAMLVSGLISKHVLDSLQKDLIDKFKIFLLVVFYFLIPMIGQVFEQINVFFVAKLKIKIQSNIKLKLLENSLKPNFLFDFEQELNKFRDDTEDIGMFFSQLTGATIAILIGISAAILLFFVNIKAATISILSCLSILFVIFILRKFLFYMNQKKKFCLDQTLKKTSQIISNIYFIKANSKSSLFLKNLISYENKKNRYTFWEFAFEKFLQILSSNLVLISMSFVLIIMINDFREGLFTVGSFALFEYYLYVINSVPSKISLIVKNYTKFKISLKRIGAVS
jgi:ABC-type multidrug transport system fused ATPase/permease subunit